MNRAERRASAKAERARRWGNLARDYRTLADNPLLSMEDRTALRTAAAKLDAGRRPLVVLASIAATLARVDAMTQEGEL